MLMMNIHFVWASFVPGFCEIVSKSVQLTLLFTSTKLVASSNY